MFVGKKKRNGKEFSGGRRQPNTQLNLSGSVSFDGNTKKKKSCEKFVVGKLDQATRFSWKTL